MASGQGPIAAPVAEYVSSVCGSVACCPRAIICAQYLEHTPDAGGVVRLVLVVWLCRELMGRCPRCVIVIFTH